MDTATLLIAHRVMTARNIRGTARAMGRPVSSIAAAMNRLESQISVPLLRKAGTGIVLTLDAERLLPRIQQLAAISEEIMTLGTPARRDLGVTLNALSRFAFVAEAGSIRGAAKSLGLGQPQLARQMGQIETILGCQLLTRGVGGSRTTDAGKRLLVLARALEAGWNELAHAADGRSQRSAATIRLGSIVPMGHESFVASTLAQLVMNWTKDAPRQPLFVASTTTEGLIAGLKRGIYDIVLLNSISVPDEFYGFPIAKAQLSLVGRSDLLKGQTAPNNLAPIFENAVLALPSPQSGLRQVINRYLSETLSETETDQLNVIEVDSMPVIINMVLNHNVISILPSESVAKISHDLGQIPLPPEIGLPYWLVCQRNPRSHHIAEEIIKAISRSGQPTS
ncbi:LysR family transcriptional regulator [Paracoccus aminophilus]|uniref:Transcriptional regulator, LysR family n=1 Tax=Paracoccus aminophilus JCM 7686 TaxID=1367847 RepID=S5YBU2_PARAH|nr:LysR family transcriptional regulator [Paracoccus aminophilus]AGT08923.1 transcriptional regulator, LysR family [Paracoccus aminophilus JCM 7686]